MNTRQVARSSALLAGGALVLALTAACQGQSSASGTAPITQASNPATGPVTATVTAPAGAATASSGQDSSGGTGSGAAAGGSGSGARTSSKSNECKAGQLKVTEGEGDDAGAGSTYPAVQFTNTSSKSCVMEGFPGVSYVTGDSGQQVGGAASRSGSIGPEVTLAPGAMASAIVQMAQTANFDAGQCKPVAVRGLRIYAPDDTAALFLPFSGSQTTACSSTSIPNGTQMSVQTVKSGSGSE
jgi:hypothetical protein